jgi:hypothetical protein
MQGDFWRQQMFIILITMMVSQLRAYVQTQTAHIKKVQVFDISIISQWSYKNIFA